MKRIIAGLLGIVVCYFVLVNEVYRHSPAWANTNFTTWAFSVYNTTRTFGARWMDLPLSVKEFGAKCDGSTDDTAAIQAAIDYAYPNNIQQIMIPASSGACMFTPPLFLDIPGNLRGGQAAYSAGTTYGLNATVNSGGINYISIQAANTGNTPVSSATWWRAFNWSSGTTYVANDIASYNGIPWLALQSSNTNHAPVNGSAYWQATTVALTKKQFSLCLTGQGGVGENEPTSSRLWTLSSAPVALWVGPGDRMCVKQLMLRGDSSKYRVQNQNVGIAIAGGAEGALISETNVWSFGVCYQTGTDVDQLAADNTFFKPRFVNCGVGIDIARTQNDINSIYDPIGDAMIGIRSDVDKDIKIFGGNLSSTNFIAGGYTIGSISGMTALTCVETVSAGCYTFTATVTLHSDGNDAYWTRLCSSPTTQSTDTCGVYNSFTIVTAHYGVIPLVLDAFDTNTNIATFRTWYPWARYFFQNKSTLLTLTDIQAEIAAVTKVYATERVTVYEGTAIRATGGFIEQPQACTTLIHQFGQFNADRGTVIENERINNDLSFYQWAPGASPSDAHLAIYLCAMSFPMIYSDFSNLGASLVLKHINGFNNLAGQAAGSHPLVIDLAGQGRFIVEDVDLHSPNVRTSSALGTNSIDGSQNANTIGGSQGPSLGGGGGEWDITPFVPLKAITANAALYYNMRNGVFGLENPYHGFFPAFYTTPRLTPTMYTALASIAGTALGTYPLIDGRTIYSVVDWNSGTLTHAFARSAHKFFSYGLDLTTSNVSGLNWNYKGQTFFVYVDPATDTGGNTIGWLIPGLGITLDNGTGAHHYIVTGTYPGLNYFTVMDGEVNTANYTPMVGTKTVVYSCPGDCPATKIGQDAYSWTQYP